MIWTVPWPVPVTNPVLLTVAIELFAECPGDGTSGEHVAARILQGVGELDLTERKDGVDCRHHDHGGDWYLVDNHCKTASHAVYGREHHRCAGTLCGDDAGREVIVATLVLLDVHVTGRPVSTFPLESYGVAASVSI